MAVPGICFMTIGSCLLLILSVPSHAVSSEAGWQQARIQHVLKARKLMNKERQRKREQAAEKEHDQDPGRKKQDKESIKGQP